MLHTLSGSVLATLNKIYTKMIDKRKKTDKLCATNTQHGWESGPYLCNIAWLVGEYRPRTVVFVHCNIHKYKLLGNH